MLTRHWPHMDPTPASLDCQLARTTHIDELICNEMDV
jgi:hypothetical protein